MPGVDGDFLRLLDPQIQPVATARFAERMATRDAADWARELRRRRCAVRAGAITRGLGRQ